MDLHQWAIKHHVSAAALAELQTLWGSDGADTMPAAAKGATSEAAVQSAVVLEAAHKGVRLWRNNVGVLQDDTGRPVRYGLANDTSARNKVVKSGDLIGIRPVLITPAHLGTVVGQFVSRECKAVGWRYAGTEREIAQLAWAQLIISCGGDAAFVTGEGSL